MNFKRVYLDVNYFRIKLDNFAQNYDKYHNKKVDSAFLTVAGNKYYDYSDEQVERINPGMKRDTKILDTECGFEGANSSK